jgi:hypothetical protein
MSPFLIHAVTVPLVFFAGFFGGWALRGIVVKARK